MNIDSNNQQKSENKVDLNVGDEADHVRKMLAKMATLIQPNSEWFIIDIKWINKW